MMGKVMDKPPIEVGEAQKCLNISLREVGTGQSRTPATLTESISTAFSDTISPK